MRFLDKLTKAKKERNGQTSTSLSKTTLRDHVSAGDRANVARDWPVAEAEYKKALNANPEKSDIWIQLGHSQKEQRRLDEAEASYREAIKLDDSVFDYHIQLAHLLKSRGRFQESISAFCAAERIDPNDGDVDRELRSLRNTLRHTKQRSQFGQEPNSERLNSALFVSWTGRQARPYFDPSTRYRCFNPAAALRARGIRTQVIAQSTFEKDYNSYLNYDVIILHRPCLTAEIAPFLVKYGRSGRVFADFDDLTFDVSRADETPAVRTRGVPSAQVRQYLSNTAEAASQIQNIIVSTQPLAAIARAKFASSRVDVVPNCLDPATIGLSYFARKGVQSTGRQYTFGYFAGTASHDGDFKMIARSLANALRADSTARLIVAGPVNAVEQLEDVKKQVDVTPLVSFSQLPGLMASTTNVLAPLERTTFTNCKSGLKFFEAAAVGCTVIATPIPDIDRFSSPLLVKCSTPDEWDSSLLSPKVITELERDCEARTVCETVSINEAASLLVEILLRKKDK